MTQTTFGRINVRGPAERNTSHEISTESATLGRSEENAIVLPDPAISRRHCQLLVQNGNLHLMDLGSLNGTVVNGMRLAARQPFQLRDGDVAVIGPFTLTYEGPPARAGRPVAEPVDLLPMDQPRPLVQRIDSPTVAVQTGLGPTASAPKPDMQGVFSGNENGKPVTLAGDQPARVMVWVNGEARTYPLAEAVTKLGRGTDNDIVIPDPTVSRHHAEIRATENGFEIVDLGSGNGIYHYGQRIERQPMTDNESFRIGDAVQLVFLDRASVLPTTPPPESQAIDMGARQTLTIGREPTNDLVLAHPQVSRHHARIDRRDGVLIITDLGSTNGTFVNGAKIKEATRLAETDHLQIGPYAFSLAGGMVESIGADGEIQIEALGLTRVVGKGVTILNNVYLAIKPREFVAVVGASGSGKSTLVDALSGFRPATSGKVLYNGRDLYHTYDAFRTSIGYVPQDDIIHRDLSIYDALTYAARLRLPRDTTAVERAARIDEVIADLGLDERKNTVIGRLSGGQRKRVSIGVELLTKPSMFFLDEPTSGLDPATETRMMRLMRELADQGRTLILITHATQNILLCDKVVFMSRGGQVAFFGTPQEALDFFQVQEFVDIYELLDKEPSVGYFAGRYKTSHYQTIHLGDLDTRPIAAVEAGPAPKSPRPTQTGISRLQQYWVLTQRYLAIMFSNKKALAILLLQAPLIALLLSLLYNRAIFNDLPLVIPAERFIESRVPLPTNPLDVPANCGLTQQEINDLPEPLRSNDLKLACGNASNAMNLLFLITIVSVWLGTSNAAKEIVKELPVYRRERMVCLKILPYLFSKLTVLFGLSVIQTILLLGIVMTFIAFPLYGIGTPVGIFLVTLATFFTATLLGLFVSSLVASNDEAGNLVPILLIPQIVFAGAIFPFGQMGDIARYIANLTISKWSWQALGAIAEIERIARAQGGSSLGMMDDDKWGKSFDLAMQWDLAALAAFCVVFLAGSYIALKRKDSL